MTFARSSSAAISGPFPFSSVNDRVGGCQDFLDDGRWRCNGLDDDWRWWCCCDDGGRRRWWRLLNRRFSVSERKLHLGCRVSRRVAVDGAHHLFEGKASCCLLPSERMSEKRAAVQSFHEVIQRVIIGVVG